MSSSGGSENFIPEKLASTCRTDLFLQRTLTLLLREKVGACAGEVMGASAKEAEACTGE